MKFCKKCLLFLLLQLILGGVFPVILCNPVLASTEQYNHALK